ncbi:MAG: hypothetical protein ACI935_002127 [Moritella dasanensis]
MFIVRGHFIELENEDMDLMMSGAKTFVIRKNDRNFEESDLVCFVRKNCRGASDYALGRISHVTKSKQWFGNVVFGFNKIERGETRDVKQFRDEFKKALSL